MGLVEEGALELGTPARTFLDADLPLVGDDVTVEHLLAHRSGIGGAIVTTASICSFGEGADLVAYHANKHAIVGLTYSAAVCGGPIGVPANAVAPGTASGSGWTRRRRP